MHEIRYLPLAEKDLLEALDYLSNKLSAPKAAENLLKEFDEAIQIIAQNPYSHELYWTDRPMRDEIRKVPVGNFVLYYAVFQDYVEIRRFLHGRMDRQKSIVDMWAAADRFSPDYFEDGRNQDSNQERDKI